MDEHTPHSIGTNQDYDWDLFDWESYVGDNYADISPPDRAIFERLVEIHRELPAGGSMIEIGSGPNLYPLLPASLYRADIHVTDIAVSNLEYIRRCISLDSLPSPWPKWTELLSALNPRSELSETIGGRLSDICTFERLSIFDLPENLYDLSSMHFVAESITNDHREFVAACDKAIRCVRMGGSFVASFMLSSQGYFTGDVEFPAIEVDQDAICRVLDSMCTQFDYLVLTGSAHLVREGHEGILLSHGIR